MENPYIYLAKLAIETNIKEKKAIEPPADLPNNFYKDKVGVFVTIEHNGVLRGCIGTYLATRPNLAEEIIHNAIAASNEKKDDPITAEELPKLVYTVYVLHTPKPVKNISELDPKKYGILVKTSPLADPNNPNSQEVIFDGHQPHKTAILLPDLKGINTPEEQFSVACQKGNIVCNEEKLAIYKVEVEKYQ